MQPSVLTLHSSTEMNCRMFRQCSARGWEFKKVLVPGNAKADDWNIFVYVYFCMFIYIHILTCICIYSALKINSLSTLTEITYCKEGKKEPDSKIWMIRKNTCRFFCMNWVYPNGNFGNSLMVNTRR